MQSKNLIIGVIVGFILGALAVGALKKLNVKADFDPSEIDPDRWAVCESYYNDLHELLNAEPQDVAAITAAVKNMPEECQDLLHRILTQAEKTEKTKRR